MNQATYPVQFSVDYPDRPLDRLTTFFRVFVAIPILIVRACRGERGNRPREEGPVRWRPAPAGCCSSLPC